MSFKKNINNYWDYLEQKYPTPKYVGQIKCLEFKELKDAIDNKNEKFLKSDPQHKNSTVSLAFFFISFRDSGNEL